MSQLHELPIGAGAGKRPRRGDRVDGELELEPNEQGERRPLVLVDHQADELELEQPAEWKAERLERPLQIVVGKSVNYAMRRRTGLETRAGLMSDEHAGAIADPLAEIFNRFEPMRALARKQTEIALSIAIYDYVQETVVTAGRDVALHRDAIAAANARRLEHTDTHYPPPPAPAIDNDQEVPL